MHITVELTEQERKFLAELAAKQYEGAPDNLGTRTPIHIVERIEKEFVEDNSDEAFLDVDNDYQEYESWGALIDARRARGENLPEYEDVEYEHVNGVWINSLADYCKAYHINAYSGRYITSYHPVAFFFVRDEAVRYRDGYQAHNCGNCRIYTYSPGYANEGDFPVFRELLMKMGHGILQEQAQAEREGGNDGHVGAV